MKSRLIVVAGIVASGKSTLARGLAEALGAEHLEADALRGELHEAGHAEAFVPGFSETLYPALLRRAAAALARGADVVLDGCFRSRALRAQARALAARHAAAFLLVEVRVPHELARARLAERERAMGRPGWQAMLDAFLAQWEPVEELAAGEHAVVDGAAPLAEGVARVAARLGVVHGVAGARLSR